MAHVLRPLLLSLLWRKATLYYTKNGMYPTRICWSLSLFLSEACEITSLIDFSQYRISPMFVDPCGNLRLWGYISSCLPTAAEVLDTIYRSVVEYIYIIKTGNKMVTVTKIDEEQFKAQIVQQYTDIIGEKLGGKVLAFSDEWFAASENLIKPKAPIRDATRFVYSGAWYDGWETRRHNTAECDWVIFKMGVSSASLIGCEINTAFFNGNHAPAISVEAASLADDGEGFDNVKWTEIIPKLECGPSQKQFFVRDQITDETFTHVKLKMYPDGGIARFRLYGKVKPILPTDVSTILDTASAIQGGVCTSFSDQHFGSADNILLPGRGVDMSDGWETKRSRTPGHVDWVIVKLGHKTNIRKMTVDTAHFRGNFPQYIRIEGLDYLESEDEPTANDANWETLVEKSKTGPDAEHDYQICSDKGYTHVKLVVIPDGGVKRFRCWGTVVI